MKYTSKEEIRKELFSFDVSNYTDWVDRKAELIADLIAGAPTLENLIPMTGIKAGTVVELPRFSNVVEWQTGNCPTAFSGTTTIQPRTINPVFINDRESLCPDELTAKLPMLQAAGARQEDISFADLFMEQKIKNNSKELEKLAWVGSLTGGSGNLAFTDGWIEVANAELGSLAFTEEFGGLSAGSASITIAQIRTILNNRTDEMRERDDIVIYMSPADFDIVAEALVDTFGIDPTGLFLNTGDENQLGQVQVMKWPGASGVLLKATHGLSSDGSLFCTFQDNLIFATDLESDLEEVSMFYDKFHKALVSDIVFTIGFQYKQSEHVIYIRKV